MDHGALEEIRSKMAIGRVREDEFRIVRHGLPKVMAARPPCTF